MLHRHQMESALSWPPRLRPLIDWLQWSRPGLWHCTGFLGNAMAAALIILLLPASMAHASIVPVGTTLQVNTAPGSDFVRVMGLPDGGFVVLWFSGPSAQPTLVAKHFDADAKAVGSEFQLDGFAEGLAEVGGNLVFGISPGEGRLVLREVTAGGAAAAMSPVNNLINVDGGLALAGALQDGVILVWSDTVNVFGQRFDSNAEPTGRRFVITSLSDTSNQNGLNVASTSDGGVVVAWWDESFGSIWGRRLDAQDMPLGPTFLVAGGLANTTGPELCTDTSGDFVAAWDSQDPIEFRRYNAQGQPVSPHLSTGVGSLTSMVCLSQQTIVVTGQNDRVHSIGPAVVGRAFDVENHPLGQFVIPQRNFSPGPSVAVLGDGTFVVTWSVCAEFHADCDIFAQRFALAAGADCPGDCNGDGVVTIDELISAINIALIGDSENDSTQSCYQTDICPSIDTDLDCQVSVTELVAAVAAALNGCGG